MATAQVTANSSWAAIFPPTVQTFNQSLKFVKKLLVIGVSSLAYLRFNIPDEDFVPINLEGVRVMLLRNSARYSSAIELINTIKAAVDALDKGYLKELMLTVYLDDPDEIYEMYTFSFGSTGMELSAGQTQTSLFRGPVTSKDQLFRSTKSLLRRLIVLTQDLPILPEEAFLGVKVTYHKDLTPPDYHAPGFVPCTRENVVRFRRSSEATPSVTLGDVSTKWHTVSGSIRSMALAQSTPLDFSTMFPSQESNMVMSPEQEVQPSDLGDASTMLPNITNAEEDHVAFKMEEILEETAKILESNNQEPMDEDRSSRSGRMSIFSSK